MKEKLFALLITLQALIQNALADVPTDTGHHLFRDKVAIKARRIWRIPIAEQGRDLVKTTGNMRYGTWQMSNGRKSFPEVHQVYSWDREDEATGNANFGSFNGPYYSMFKDTMGKYGWWRLSGSRENWPLAPWTIYNNNGAINTNNKRAAVRARIDTLTGECTHKMHYRAPYLIIPCYTQNTLHNTLKQPMIYDYYINIHNNDANPTNNPNTDNDNWPIFDQNYMNYTRKNLANGFGGHGINNFPSATRNSVNFNHRIHTTTIRFNRNPNTSGAAGQSWWTLMWNGPYQGQLSQAGRQPTGGAHTGAPGITDQDILYFRPHNDFPYLKTCRVPGGHFTNLRVIEDIVQPDPNNTDGDQGFLIIIWLQQVTNAGVTTTQHRVSKCPITNINADSRAPPWGAGDITCLGQCITMTAGTFGTGGIGSFSRGGLKYVPRNYNANGGFNGANNDYIIGVNQDATGTGAGTIFRCQVNRDAAVVANVANGAFSNCVSTQACQEDAGRGNFGYFSDCRSANNGASCGIYYMGLNSGAIAANTNGNVAQLMNRVYCADIIKFGGTQPLLYRRHFTGVHAYDITQAIQTGIDSVAKSMNIRSYQEFYIYNSNYANPTNTNQITNWGNNVGRLYDRERSNTFYDYTITGKVVRVQDSNKAEGNYQMLGYLNHTYALPFRRRDWKGNALNINPVGSQVNHSVLHLNDVHMDNTENWRLRDQFPLGPESIRIRTDFDNTANHHFEINNCNMNHNNTVKLNCSWTGSRQAISANEHIKRVWWFEESIVILTTQSVAGTTSNEASPPSPAAGINQTPTRERSRLYAYRKSDNTWSSHDFGTNTNNNDINGGVIEFIDVAEHEGDLIIAYKSWNHRYITRPIVVARGPNLNLGTGSWTTAGMPIIPTYTYDPRHHPTPSPTNDFADNGWTGRRFFPLEDDSCITGFNIVRDTSWKIRYLMDCNRVANSRDGSSPGNNRWGNTKWIGDHHIFDSNHVQTYKTHWNITLRPSEPSGTDYLGDDFEYGCATREYVFIFDTDSTNGWIVAAVHMHTHSMRFFDLGTFGITGVRNMYCVGDYAVLSASSTPSSSPSAVVVLYGTNLEDARRRIHSIKKFPGSITSISPTLVDDKIWIRFVMNNRPYYRVAYMDGPTVLFNSSRTQWTNSQTISHSNGINTVNTTKTDVTFIWANNEVNMTNFTRTAFTSGTWNLDSISNITGHVYGANFNGINSNLGSIRQRVYFERDQGNVRRRILHTDTSTVNYRYDTSFSDTRNRFYEMRIKGNRMARLSYDRGYSRFHYYTDPFTSRRNYWTGYECELLDFSIDQNTTTVTHQRMYWGTVCQETHYKEVRIHRMHQSGAANGFDGGGKIVHNDDIHRFTMDYVSYKNHLLTFYNENDLILNMSVYNLHDTIANGDSNHHSDIAGPTQTVLQLNGKFLFFFNYFNFFFFNLPNYFLVSDYSVFQTNSYTGIAYAPLYGGEVRVRHINKASNTFTSLATTGHSLFNISSDLGRIDHMDCTNSEIASSDNGVHCVFVGPDRRFFHYMMNYSTLTSVNATQTKWTYLMYKDYEAMDVQIGSRYIIMKARSRDLQDNTILTYLRQDGNKGGNGFLYSGLNGTTNGFNKWEWTKTKVQLAEFGGSHRIFVQRKEDTKARVYLIGQLRITLSNNDWTKQNANCIHFNHAENTKCVPVGDVWYRDIPNQPGPPEKKIEFDSGDFFLKVFLWIAAAVVLIAALALVYVFWSASPKPGYKAAKQDMMYESRAPRERVVEEVVEYRGGRSSARGLNYQDPIDVSQEQMYGDYAL